MSDRRRSARRRGMSLIEICVGLSLIAILGLISLSALSQSANKGNSRGLAAAIMEEFEATRQLALRSGQPVALGIPTGGGGSPRACALYRLQGWNTPYVTWSFDFQGDHPGMGFAAALWAGAPDAGPALDVPETAKYFNFDQASLTAWLPDGMEQDYIFCFLPDGSLITNGLRTSGGRYTVVLAADPTFDGAPPTAVNVTSGTEPSTIFISPTGGVELVKGCPGGNVPRGTGQETTAPAQPRTENDQQAEIYLSELKVRPNPTGLPGEGICVPGQVVTLEIFAHCPQGEALFANWTHPAGNITNQKGNFTHPIQSSVLPGEADRMEYISPDRVGTLPEPVNWGLDTGGNSAAPPPNTGFFRATWTWTVPSTTVPGEMFSLTANVQNAQANAVIRTPPRATPARPAPMGRMLVERRDPATGAWQLWRMNPDGSGEVRITPAGFEEMMPSVDRAGNLMAFLRCAEGAAMNQRYVVVRPVEGGPETVFPGPGDFSSVSLNPEGTWVAYREDSADLLHVIRTNKDPASHFTKPQVYGGSGYTVKKQRAGWSQNGQYVIYEHEAPFGAVCLWSVNVEAPNASPDPAGYRLLGPMAMNPSGTGIPRLFGPTSYTHGGKEYVITSASGDDSYIFSFEIVGGDYTANQNPAGALDPLTVGTGLYNGRPRKDWDGGGNSYTVGSTNVDEDYPAVSASGQLTYTTSPTTTGAEDEQDQQIVILPEIDANGVFFGNPPIVLNVQDVRRAIFLPPPPQ